MKVAHAESHVLGSGGLQEVHTFKIRTSAHAFKILSSGLYSDKVTAVLREIGCNAYDAHVEAKCPSKPFIVKLPNSIDNQFYIKDFGPGLSHADVMELYTTYFASNKQNSNDFTGAFGLGSKSPFSYTDSFTITVSQDGLRRVYQAFIGEDGAPTIALMSQTKILLDDEWQRGLSVGFPVKPHDYHEFNSKAQKVFMVFNPLPIVIGGDPIKPMQFLKDCGTYAIVDRHNDHYTWGDKCYVQMGNVVYPVQVDSLGVNSQSLYRYSAKGEDAIISCMGEMKGVLLRFKMGDVQVAASREELQYDKDSQQAIKAALIVAIKDVVKEIEKMWLKVTNGAWQDRADFHSEVRAVTQGVYVTEELFKACGVKDAKELDTACSRNFFDLPKFDKNMGKATYSVITRDRMNTERLRYARPTGIGTSYIDFAGDIVIIAGPDKRALARVKKAFSEGTVTGRVVLVCARYDMRGTKADVDALLSDVSGLFKGVEVKELSSFDPPPLMKYNKKKGMTPLPLSEVRVEAGGKMKITDILPDNLYYVKTVERSNWGHHNIKYCRLNGDEVVYQYHWDRTIRRIQTINKELGINIKLPVYIRKYDAKRWHMEKRPEWKPWEEYVIEQLCDKTNLNLLSAKVGKHKYRVDLNYHGSDSTNLLDNLVYMKEKQPDWFKSIEPVLKNHKIAALVDKVHKDSKAAVKSKKEMDAEPLALSSYREVIAEWNIEVVTPEFKKVVESLGGQFPGAEKVPYEVYENIACAAPSILPAFVEAILSKGST